MQPKKTLLIAKIRNRISQSLFLHSGTMRVLLCPDSFKGTLSAFEAAECIAEGIRDADLGIETIRLPVADGGEGTVQVLVSATGGQLREAHVTGPLGLPVVAIWGMLGDGTTAVIETASASGLSLVPEDKRNPRITTTFGTGELIRAALDAGAKRIIMGLGGSATNDGGAGMAEALGVRLLDRFGNGIGRGGAALAELDRIDISSCDARLRETEIIAACDVDNVLTGPEGASAIYAPQKGALPEDVAVLDHALTIYAAILHRTFQVDFAAMKGTGAAGGLGAGLVAFCGAVLQRGADIVLDAIGFDEQLASVDAIVTGEGRVDGQMKYGKALRAITERAARRGLPVYAIAGSIDGPASAYCGAGGFTALLSLSGMGISRAHAESHAKSLLWKRARELAGIMTGSEDGS
jgi:glycerate kinase